MFCLNTVSLSSPMRSFAQFVSDNNPRVLCTALSMFLLLTDVIPKLALLLVHIYCFSRLYIVCRSSSVTSEFSWSFVIQLLTFVCLALTKVGNFVLLF